MRRKSSNYIYGGEVFIQQKSQINPHNWKGREELNWYLLNIIEKDIHYFKIFGTLTGKSLSLVMKETKDNLDDRVKRRVGCERDDFISEPTGRVHFWSLIDLKWLSPQTTGRGHGKNQGTFKGDTFCARDRGSYYLRRNEKP